MKSTRIARLARASAEPRRGSALLMAFLMLIVIYAIVFQLWYTTSADLRVTQNDVTTTQIDMAIESALQEVFDRLRTDGETDASSGQDAGGAAGAAGAAAAAAGGGEAEGGEGEGPSDSREDPWGRAQRTTIGDIELRIFIQDEDSKFNLLTILASDEAESEEAFERLVRLLDMIRDGSTVDLDRSDAIRLAETMRRHLKERSNSLLPKPKLLSDDEEQRDLGMPLSLSEFAVFPRFESNLFRDFRDERGDIVHALGAYVTVWNSIARGSVGDAGAAAGGGAAGGGQAAGQDGGAQAGGQSGGQSGGQGGGQTGGQSGQAGGQGAAGQTGGQGGTQGGGGAGGAQGGGAPAGGGGGGGGGSDPNWGMVVNINTAPIAVLKCLFDDRDVPSRFWDNVLEYRNLPEEEEDQQSSSSESEEPAALDEYGREIIQRQIFDSLDELSEIDGYDRLDESIHTKLQQLLSVRSQVFSIFVTARRKTGADEDFGGVLGARRDDAREEVRGKGLVRSVRCVVWRYVDGEEVRIVPIVRWEVLDYTPLEVLDYPDEDR